jgi:hypothetical protein
MVAPFPTTAFQLAFSGEKRGMHPANQRLKFVSSSHFAGELVIRTLLVLNNFETIYQCFDSTFASFSQLPFLL